MHSSIGHGPHQNINMNLSISDPATAIACAALDALAAYCNFLCTPEGQKFSADVQHLAVWERLMGHIPTAAQATTAPTTIPSAAQVQAR